jgi:tetrahydromethanopterin S-methyltransferase subunit G
MMVARRLEVPEVLRRAWGDEAAEAFAVWLAGVLEERAVSRDEFRQILSRLDVLERDVAALQADVRELRREMNERFDRLYIEMNDRFDRLYGEMNERFDRFYREMNERFDRMGERMDRMYHQMVVQTRWLIGALAVIGTVISLLLAIGQFAR